MDNLSLKETTWIWDYQLEWKGDPLLSDSCDSNSNTCIDSAILYQYQYSIINHLVYSMVITRWDYILGATLYNKSFMDTATSNYNIEIFTICMYVFFGENI